MPNKANEQKSITVEVTARLKLSLDNTWELVSFKRDTAQIVKEDPTKQKRLYLFDDEPKPDKFIYSVEENLTKPLKKLREKDDYKPASWYLNNAKLHGLKARKSNNYKGRPIGRVNHCSRCGMVNKNKLTCMSVSREDGTFESYKHRTIYL